MMWGYSWTAGSPDGGFFLGIAYGPNATEANDPRFALPRFDRLFERQRVLPDGPEREALMREAKNLLVAYMPYKVHVAHRGDRPGAAVGCAATGATRSCATSGVSSTSMPKRLTEATP